MGKLFQAFDLMSCPIIKFRFISCQCRFSNLHGLGGSRSKKVRLLGCEVESYQMQSYPRMTPNILGCATSQLHQASLKVVQLQMSLHYFQNASFYVRFSKIAVND